MAILDYPLHLHDMQRDSSTNPYANELDSDYIRGMSIGLVAQQKPFIDRSSNPDIGASNLAVYALENDSPFADISRAIEGTVMKNEWEKDPTHAKDESAAVEGNTIFFLVMDVADPTRPVPAASLSVADCLRGPSETVATFREHNPDSALPEELTVTPEDRDDGLWDVMAIMAPREYRRKGGDSLGAAVWAYHALYEASQLMHVHRWIANITDAEHANLTGIGIPFEQIPDTGKITKVLDTGKPITSGFYTIDVDAIRASMTERIAELDAMVGDRDFWKIYSNMARIAMDGRRHDS
jgi:hypothetical protein